MGAPPTASPTLAAWGNAWLGGHTGLDDAADAVEEAHGPQLVDGEPLRAALARFRPRGLSAFTLGLPVAGDPLGLAGGPDLNTAALAAGEAVLLRFTDYRIGLVPGADRRGSSYTGTAWTSFPAADRAPEHISVADAEHGLLRAVRESTALFDGVDDIAGHGPDTARALGDLRGNRGIAAPGLSPRAARLADRADRLAEVVRLAGGDTGRGLSIGQMDVRRDAVRLLDTAVRRARVAAYCAGAPD